MKIKSIFIIIFILFHSCKNGISSKDFQTDKDFFYYEEKVEENGLEPDISDLPVEQEELNDDEIGYLDAITEDFDEMEGEVEHIDLIPLSPSRPAMPCGANCRQVSFLSTGDVGIEYDVWGDWLVIGTWQRPGGPVTHQIALVNLVSLNYFIIDEKNFRVDSSGPAVGHPSIWQNKILYIFQINVEPGINYFTTFYLVDFQEKIRTPIWNYTYPYGSSALGSTCIFGNIAAWWDDRTSALGGDQVYMMDLNERRDILVSDHCCLSHNPQIYGTKIVYDEGMSGSNMNIWLYDVATGEHRQLTNGDWDQFCPDIYENIVVWTDGRNGGTAMSETNMDVYMMDLTTGEERPVCTYPSTQKKGVFVWGTKVTYADTRNDPVYPDEGAFATEIDIYMTDIETGQETQLTSLPGKELYPLIHGNHVYFAKKDLENIWSVFEITLE